MAAVLGHLRANRRDLNDLVPERRGIVPGERVGASAASVGLQLDDAVRGQFGTSSLGMSRLATLPLPGRRLGRGRLGVWRVGGRGLGRVRGGLTDPGLEVSESRFEIPDVRLHGRRQGVEDIRR
jgi:hypothetical protein